MKDSAYKDAEKNLHAVIAMLRTVPDEQFNMAHWWLDDGMAFDDNRNRMYKVADGPCGCVVGHLIQRGILSGEIITPKELPGEAFFPYEYRDRIFVQIADALKLYNSKYAEFLFDQYSYLHLGRPITRQDVIRRLEFVLTEIQEMDDANG